MCVWRHAAFLVELESFVLWSHVSESEDEDTKLLILDRTSNLFIVRVFYFSIAAVVGSLLLKISSCSLYFEVGVGENEIKIINVFTW